VLSFGLSTRKNARVPLGDLEKAMDLKIGGEKSPMMEEVMQEPLSAMFLGGSKGLGDEGLGRTK
jgi:hypothetical protein